MPSPTMKIGGLTLVWTRNVLLNLVEYGQGYISAHPPKGIEIYPNGALGRPANAADFSKEELVDIGKQRILENNKDDPDANDRDLCWQRGIMAMSTHQALRENNRIGIYVPATEP